MKKVLALMAAAVLGLSTVAPVLAGVPPGQRGYEGQPGNQGGYHQAGQRGYEGQPGNQGGSRHNP